MASWSLVLHGTRDELQKAEMPAGLNAVVASLLDRYPGPAPVSQRIVRRPKDPSRQIETAQASDGSTHAVGNFQDVTITHQGVYRVAVQGNPDDYGTIRIEIDPDFSLPSVTEKVG